MANAVGIDLCSDYTELHIYGNDNTVSIPTVICRDREKELFSIGEEAYRRTLGGGGVLVDKLLRLALRNGTATIGGTCYRGRALLSVFLKEALSELLSGEEPLSLPEAVTELVITVPVLSEEAEETVRSAVSPLGIPEERIRLIGHTEAMMYYVLSRDRDLYNSTVAVFNLSEEKLFYYEMKVLRGIRRQSVAGEGAPMDEGFSLDILKNEAGRKLGDSILASFAGRVMARKNYSAVFLTGKGFEETEHFPQFCELICRRRKVLSESGLFARGASEAANDRQRPESAFPYIFLCESRIASDISMEVMTRTREERILLTEAGTPWTEAGGRVEVIPSRQDYIGIDIVPVDKSRKQKNVKIPLMGFPTRPDRCTRVQIELSFSSARKLKLCLRDKGFGEIFPGTDACIYEEIEI
ncbi:MAG: DUF5716 family protein [Eubacteriales bacterium]|nr:DUF5716 family protein [Eubacteriales bacterium]